MFFNEPDKSHFHTTSLPFSTHCSNVKKLCQSHFNCRRHNIKTFNILPSFLETLQHFSWHTFTLLQKQQNLLDINYDGSNYFSNLNWPEIYFWKNDVFTKFVLDNRRNGSSLYCWCTRISNCLASALKIKTAGNHIKKKNYLRN